MNKKTIIEVFYNLLYNMAEDKEKVTSIINSLNQQALNEFWCYITKKSTWIENHTAEEIIKHLYK